MNASGSPLWGAVFSLLTALIGVLAGAWITLWQRRYERLWDERRLAYQDTLQALGKIQLWAGEGAMRAVALSAVPLVQGEELEQQARQAVFQLFVQAPGYRLLMSETASQILDTIVDELAALHLQAVSDGDSEAQDQMMEQVAAILVRHATVFREAAWQDLHRARWWRR